MPFYGVLFSERTGRRIVRHGCGPNADDRELIHDLYPSLRRLAAVVGPADVEPDDLVQEALLRSFAGFTMHLRRYAEGCDRSPNC